jgi:hypothetical protein
MGSYKKAHGKTRVGNALSKVGGFFSGIFGGKKTSTTTTNTDTSGTVATPPISGNANSGFTDVLAGITSVVGAVIASAIPSGNTNTTTDTSGTGGSSNGSGSGVSVGLIAGIVLLLGGIGFLIFRKRK